MAEDQTSSINRFFSSSRNLAASTLISRVLGLFRETLTAAVIGGGALMSGWTLALTWANTFRRILGEGELGKAIVPIISLSIEKEGPERARDRFSTILLWLTLLLCALAVVLGVPYVLTAYAPTAARYQWRKDGVAIAGATGPTCSVVELQTGSAVYDVLAYDAYGRTVASTTATVIFKNGGTTVFVR